MPDARAGHHGDVVYKFEDAGFDTTPTDSAFKVFGSDATMDTFDASHEAVRKYNASRRAAEIIEQNFDGGWGVTFNLSEPPWWLAAVFGQPTSALVSGALYDYTYDLDNNNDPVSLRLYAPTDGFSDYEMVPGAAVVSCSIDQDASSSPEVSLTGGYAREPVSQSTPSVSIPNFGEETYSNRHAEVQVAGSTVGRSQNTSVSYETGTELISEIGAGNMVDYLPKAFNPSITYDHITWVGETTDFLQRHRDFTSATVKLLYDNGKSGEDAYTIDFNITNSHPNQWSESGRNDPEANLVEELQDMALDSNVVVSTNSGDSGNPPGITL